MSGSVITELSPLTDKLQCEFIQIHQSFLCKTDIAERSPSHDVCGQMDVNLSALTAKLLMSTRMYQLNKESIFTLLSKHHLIRPEVGILTTKRKTTD